MENFKDLVKIYLKEIGQYDILSKDEEKRLLLEAKSGDEEAKNKIIVSNLRLVVNIAKSFINKGLGFIDLISEGNIGLINAIDKFDIEKGFRFSTYAVWWIRQSISRAVIDKGREIRIPSYKYDILSKINFFISKYLSEYQKYPNVDEISNELDINKEKIEKVLIEFQDLISLNASIGNEIILEDVISNSDRDQTEDEIIDDMIREKVKDKLNSLKEREKDIVSLRYGINGDGPKTLEEVGQIYGVTRERVRQIEKRALKKLKLELQDELEDYI